MILPEKKAIYTVITNDYDCIFPPIQPQPGWDMICFTDNPKAESKFWDIRPLPDLPEMKNLEGDPVRQARLVKILPHRFLQQYDYSVFIDGNRVLDDDMSAYISQHEGNILCLEATTPHAYAAAEVLLHRTPPVGEALLEQLAPATPLPKKEADLLEKQMRAWRKRGLPKSGGCPGTAVLGRWHNKKAVFAIMETWAKEVLAGSSYDEPAFPYACYVHKTPWTEGASQFATAGNFFSPAEELAVAVPHKGLIVSGEMPPLPEYPENPPPPGGPYGGYPFLLTIGFPVSNQIGTIRRCLEGVKPLLDAVSSELLVIDTGSTDGTVEVCQEFGARIIKFPWINDMSAARNTGIRNARSMWYMSVDDDEWFEDIGPLIAFFQDASQYDSHLNAVSYIQYNYQDEFQQFATSHYTTRIFRLSPTLHFEGRIHDTIPVEQSTHLRIPALAHHEGFAHVYRYKNRNKSMRNISILRYDMLQFPNQMRFASQMVQEYAVIENHDQTVRLGYWVQSLRKQFSAAGFYQIEFCTFAVFSHLGLAGSHRQALRYLDKHVDMDIFLMGDQCDLHYHIAKTSQELLLHKRTLEHTRAFFALQENLLKMPEEDRPPLNQIIKQSLYTEHGHTDMYLAHLISLLALNNYEEINSLLVQEDVLKLLTDYTPFLTRLYQYLLQSAQWQAFAAMHQAQLEARGEDAVYAWYVILDECAQPEHYPHLLAALTEAGVPTGPLDALFALRTTSAQQEECIATYHALIEIANNLLFETAHYFKTAAFIEAVRLKLDYSTLLDSMGIAGIDYCVAHIAALASKRAQQTYEALLASLQATTPSSNLGLYFKKQMGYVFFARRSDELDMAPDVYRQRFISNLEDTLAWDRKLYHAQLLQESGADILPTTPKASCMIAHGLAQQQQGEHIVAMRSFKDALLLDKTLKAPLNMLIDESMDAAETTLAKDKARDTEFEMLLQSIVPKIDALIDAGHSNEVVTLLQQLEAMAPTSPEVTRLKAKAGLQAPN